MLQKCAVSVYTVFHGSVRELGNGRVSYIPLRQCTGLTYVHSIECFSGGICNNCRVVRKEAQANGALQNQDDLVCQL